LPKKGENYLQHTTQKTKDRATRTPLNTGGELRCSGRVRCSCSTCGTFLFYLANPVIRTGLWLWQTEHIT